MSAWFHSTILATSLAATVAIGIATASIYGTRSEVASKSDRLQVTADAGKFVTIETRVQGGSILNRIPLDH